MSLVFLLQIVWTEQLHVLALETKQFTECDHEIKTAWEKSDKTYRKPQKYLLMDSIDIYAWFSDLHFPLWLSGFIWTTFWLVNMLGDPWSVSEPDFLSLAPMWGRFMLPLTLLQCWAPVPPSLVEQADLTVPRHKIHAIMRKLNSCWVIVPVSSTCQLYIIYDAP